ncbi:MAG: hypothetical protein GY861_00245 [bacterium]|nr:hypothetical protein [bacterium]
MNLPRESTEDVSPSSFTYLICRDDPNIRYYDREEDLVFVDLGLKGCEEITIEYVDPAPMHYGSGRAEDIIWSDPDYGDRDFDRDNVDLSRYSVRE